MIALYVLLAACASLLATVTFCAIRLGERANSAELRLGAVHSRLAVASRALRTIERGSPFSPAIAGKALEDIAALEEDEEHDDDE